MSKVTVPPVVPVPDGTMEQFVRAACRCLEASWGVADASNPVAAHPAIGDGIESPKSAAVESIQAIDQAFKAAICGDGADAVIGYAMVATSLANKALAQRALGMGMATQVRAKK